MGQQQHAKRKLSYTWGRAFEQDERLQIKAVFALARVFDHPWTSKIQPLASIAQMNALYYEARANTPDIAWPFFLVGKPFELSSKLVDGSVAPSGAVKLGLYADSRTRVARFLVSPQGEIIKTEHQDVSLHEIEEAHRVLLALAPEKEVERALTSVYATVPSAEFRRTIEELYEVMLTNSPRIFGDLVIMDKIKRLARLAPTRPLTHPVENELQKILREGVEEGL